MADDEDVDFGLEDAYAVNGPEENRKLYAAWADTYDADFVDRTQYVYHQRAVEVLDGQLRNRQGAVLDVGCGTGIVGLELKAFGFSVIDGIDISPEMLDRARAKRHGTEPVYRQLIEADLTGPISVPGDSYAAVISAGAFTHGHLGPDSLTELLRVAKPGARCAIGVNSAHFHELGFAARCEEFVTTGVIAEYEVVQVPIYADTDDTDPNQTAALVAFTVT